MSAKGAVRPAALPGLEIELGEQRPGWVATCRRPRLRHMDDLQQRELSLNQVKEIMGELLISWNFVDEDGEPIAQPREGGLDEIDPGTLALLIQAYTGAFQGEVLALPKGSSES